MPKKHLDEELIEKGVQRFLKREFHVVSKRYIETRRPDSFLSLDRFMWCHFLLVFRTLKDNFRTLIPSLDLPWFNRRHWVFKLKCEIKIEWNRMNDMNKPPSPTPHPHVIFLFSLPLYWNLLNICKDWK